MYLLPFIISTLVFVCHAAIFPETLPMMMENNEHGPWNRLTTMYEYYQNLEKLHQTEDLLRQYRTYLINMIYENNNDICNLYDYITDNTGSNTYNHYNNENDIWPTSTHDLIDNDSNNNKVDPSNRKRRSSTDNQDSTSHHQTAIDTYFEISSIVKDRLFYIELLKKLQHVCTMNSPDGVYFKRDGTKVIGKKQKFHSWGGKRDNRGKDPLKDQVIPRSYPPFHSWGG